MRIATPMKICAVAVALMLPGGIAFTDQTAFEDTADGIEERLLGKGTQQQATIRARGKSTARASSITVRGLRAVRDPEGEPEFVEEDFEMPASRAARGPSVDLAIRFGVDSAAIRRGSHSVLTELGTALKRPTLRNRTVSIAGHTDSDGTDDHNLQLSVRRGLAVRGWLLKQHGVDPSTIEVRGYGESLPLVPNDSPGNKQVNRRVEITTEPSS